MLLFHLERMITSWFQSVGFSRGATENKQNSSFFSSILVFVLFLRKFKRLIFGGSHSPLFFFIANLPLDPSRLEILLDGNRGGMVVL